MELPGLDALRAASPDDARQLETLVRRLAARADAGDWALGQVGALLQAGTRSAVLDVLVSRSAAETGAEEAWALLWSGDMRAGKSSFRVLSGRPGEMPPPDRISTTVVARVAESRVAIWTDDALRDPRLATSESIVASRSGALGCVPIAVEGGEPVAGVLYLGKPRGGRFGGASRARIEALAAIAAQVVGHDRELPVASAEPIRGLVGSSRPMVECFSAIRAFAPMPWPALVLGETGTGKEAVARALHELSPRAQLPFLAVNCATLSDELAESNLFGHERGAFTGADRRKEGVLERAEGGTVFLDEVGELSPRVQAKLLRALQESTFQRVGGDVDLRFRGRFVAATLRPLDGAGGAFRSDLFHRLSACVIRVPSLAQRRDDIPALARALLARAVGQLPGAPRIELSPEASALLSARAWPGNVRELENALRTAVAHAVAWGDDRVLPAHFDFPSDVQVEADEPLPDGEGLLAATDRFQRAMVRKALEESGGSRQDAAARLGVTRQWLHRLLTRWGGAA